MIFFHLFTVSVNKCDGCCNTFDYPYVRDCVPNRVKNLIIKAFSFLSGVNQARFLVQHELRECKCGLKESVYNSKQKWNHNECSCECKELDDLSSCKNDYMRNLSICEWEYDKACKIDQYLDIKNCSCEKRGVGKLILECEDEILKTTEA